MQPELLSAPAKVQGVLKQVSTVLSGFVFLH
jgi:hypothetical protein